MQKKAKLFIFTYKVRKKTIITICMVCFTLEYALGQLKGDS